MDKIRIQKYSNRWPLLFINEKSAIQGLLGLIQIEHTGSTAVPGLDAKPVIDMMAAVKDINACGEYIRKLATIGYVYYPEIEAQTPDRKFLQKKINARPAFHLSLTESVSDYWIDHLLFRNYLRAHPESREQYAALKRGLAEKHVDDFDGYNANKTGFINEIIARAKKSIER